MAETRKMTFTLPTALAEQFSKRVRSLDRSSFVADAISDRMNQRRQRLVEACYAANNDPEDAALRSEMDALTSDGIADTVIWDGSGPSLR